MHGFPPLTKCAANPAAPFALLPAPPALPSLLHMQPPLHPLQQILQPNDGLTLRSGQDGDDYRRDSIERDEKRLAELGRRTVEMFVITHIFTEKLEVAYREAEALKRQVGLEEERGRGEGTGQLRQVPSEGAPAISEVAASCTRWQHDLTPPPTHTHMMVSWWCAPPCVHSSLRLPRHASHNRAVPARPCRGLLAPPRACAPRRTS